MERVSTGKGGDRRCWHGITALILCCFLAVAGQAQAASAKKVLVLYDASGTYGYTGRASAIMLQNLLGHFQVEVTLKPVTSYRQGEMAKQLATFYLGTTYDERSYHTAGSKEYVQYNAFLEDAADCDAPLVWMNYNLWQLEEVLVARGESLASRFGFSWGGVVNEGYNRVKYKETELYKGVVPFANPGADVAGCTAEGDGKYACATELNKILIQDTTNTVVHAQTYSTINAAVATTPIITQAGNFWFVGDLPFTYASEEDRYLAVADILHDILATEQQEQHRALLRLEDVSAATDIEDLKAITDFLVASGIPFSVATIPYHYDGEQWTRLAGSEVGDLLEQLTRSGGRHGSPKVSIVAHGKTHQSRFAANPYNSVSGDDFEFYRVIQNADNSLTFESPLPEDSRLWALHRMQGAYWELALTGLRAFAWEAPHYTASMNTYAGVRGLYPVHYGRMTYFVDNEGKKDIVSCLFHRKAWKPKRAITSVKMLGQFFPYPIYNDQYGYKVVPENIGYYEPEPFTGYRPLLPVDLIRHAEKSLVVRDGYASFFYHPDLGTNDLREIIEGIQALGYTFTSAETVF